MEILSFQGEYRWLSNFAPCEIVLDGVKYKSIEHAYMSAKSDAESWKLFCQFTEKAGEVKKASKTIELKPDWDNIKVGVMRECVSQKFQQEPYKSRLIATEDAKIQEGNTWGDKFWGVCLKTGKGRNILGQLIMEQREKLNNAY